MAGQGCAVTGLNQVSVGECCGRGGVGVEHQQTHRAARVTAF